MNIDRTKIYQLNDYINEIYNHINIIETQRITQPLCFAQQKTTLERFYNEDFFNACDKRHNNNIDKLEDCYHVSDYWNFCYDKPKNDFIQKIYFALTYHILKHETINIKEYLNALNEDANNRLTKIVNLVFNKLKSGYELFRTKIYELELRYASRIKLDNTADYLELFAECHNQIDDKTKYWYSNYPLIDIAEDIHSIEIIGEDELEEIHNEIQRLSDIENNYIYYTTNDIIKASLKHLNVDMVSINLIHALINRR